LPEALEKAYKAIEDDLRKYTEDYGSNGWGDEYTDDEMVKNSTGMENVAEYNQLKQKMLKSVFKNGGFYVGRYETGKESDSTIPVIKQNMYPYGSVNVPQMQELAEGFAENQTGYKSSLMFGVQWNLVMKYLETKTLEQFPEANRESIRNELMVNCKEWGNYLDSTWNIDSNLNAKYDKILYREDGSWYDDGWTNITDRLYGTKEAGKEVILSTGASEDFAKQNIYDLSGNMLEATLEKSHNDELPIILRGGCARHTAGDSEGTRIVDADNSITKWTGFRVALFKDETSSTFAGGNEPEVVDVVDPIWKVENFNVDETNKEVTVDLIATDKYYDSNTLSNDQINNQIKVYVDGEEVETTLNVKKSIGTSTNLEEAGTGVKYTLTIKDWEEATKQVAKNKDFFEWSGTTKIKMAAGIIEDKSGNTSKEQEIILEEAKDQYTASITGKTETEISYTTDSRVDLTYVLYKNIGTMPYADEDYRVISTTSKLPSGTKLTLKDYAQGKTYYYYVTGLTTEYKLEDGIYIYESYRNCAGGY